jgi:hypothetical protein
MINRLIALANYLDSIDAEEEADEADQLIEEAVEPLEGPPDEGQAADSVDNIYFTETEEVMEDEAHEEIGADYNGEWNVYRGELKSPSGERISVRKIRQGSFSKVYEINNDPYNILVNTKGGISDKEILSGIYEDELSLSPDDRNPHLPQVREIGFAQDGRFYVMKKYKMPLRKGDTEDWSDYLSIKRCWVEAQSLVYNRNSNRKYKTEYYNLGGEILNEVVNCAIKNNIKQSLIEALESLKNSASAYGGEYGFEISPRNVGSDEYGNLVLVDVIFDMKAMHNIHHKKQRGL